MTILRAKTTGLLQTKTLTQAQVDNSALNLAEMQQGALILKSMPRRLVIELTNVCNINCIMCGRDERFKATMFDTKMLEKLTPILNQVEEVTLFGWGEPTVHPKFVDILKYLDHFPVRKYFVTNGMRLDQIKDSIFDQHVDIMAVSLDGAYPATNDRIRRGSSFRKITNSLAEIIKEKRLREVDYPYINFVMTGMASNIDELPDMVTLAASLGVDEVKMVYLTAFTEELRGESLIYQMARVKAAYKKAEENARELDIKLKLPHLSYEDPAGEKSHKPCYVGWRDFFLGSDGYVRPCQSSAIKLFPFDKYPTFGEMWNSPEYQEFRLRVNDEARMQPECRNCYQSSHANWNRQESFVQIGKEYAPEWERKQE